jgi:non-homologous end joining protein Ku
MASITKLQIRDFDQIPRAESERVTRVTEDERKLAEGLLNRMSNDAFQPENYQYEYRLRVLAMIDKKVKGGEVTASARPLVKRGGAVAERQSGAAIANVNRLIFTNPMDHR